MNTADTLLRAHIDSTSGMTPSNMDEKANGFWDTAEAMRECLRTGDMPTDPQTIRDYILKTLPR